MCLINLPIKKYTVGKVVTFLHNKSLDSRRWNTTTVYNTVEVETITQLKLNMHQESISVRRLQLHPAI